MDIVKARAWWSHRQGLDGSRSGQSARKLFAETGWSRCVGGANPYLAVFARSGGDVASLHAEVEKVDVLEVPSARGCTYVLPRDDFPVGLVLAQASAEVPINTAKKHLGVTEEEVSKLCDGILAALTDGPLDPAGMKPALGDLVRHLGDEGKRRGQTTTLSLGLGRLQAQGLIAREPVNGRLDSERYRYRLWADPPLAHDNPTLEQAAELFADFFFRWAAPARAEHFRWMSGLGANAAKAAMLPVGLVDVGDGWLVHPEDTQEYEDFVPSDKPCPKLVGSLDNINHLRADLDLLVDAADADAPILVKARSGTLMSLRESNSHLIVDRGRLIGLWDFDPGEGTVVAQTWVPRTAALDDEIARTEKFVRAELGDARSFSLDSPQSRQNRLAALRGQ
ncbi:MAG: winged helix DNA-binding domain-containing protein [Armatimonadetes bacterium]|nr:winged helix DNA-binding domain-containing protein [Armatimonadota bacterium]